MQVVDGGLGDLGHEAVGPRGLVELVEGSGDVEARVGGGEAASL